MTRVYPRSVRADKRIQTAIGVHTICICYLHTFATSSGIAMKAEKSVYIAITVSRSACFTTTHSQTLAICHDACAWRSPALFIVDHLMSKMPYDFILQNSQECVERIDELFFTRQTAHWRTELSKDQYYSCRPSRSSRSSPKSNVSGSVFAAWRQCREGKRA